MSEIGPLHQVVQSGVQPLSGIVSGEGAPAAVSLVTLALLQQATPQIGPFPDPVVLPVAVGQTGAVWPLLTVPTGGEQPGLPPGVPSGLPMSDVLDDGSSHLRFATDVSPSPSPIPTPPLTPSSPVLPPVRSNSPPLLDPVATSVSLLSLAGDLSGDDLAYHRQHPLTATNVNRFLATEYEAITLALMAKQQAIRAGHPANAALASLLERASTMRNVRAGAVIGLDLAAARTDMPADERVKALSLLKEFQKEVKSFFKKQKLGNFAALLNEKRVSLLRQADWPKVESESQLSTRETAHNIQVPAASVLGPRVYNGGVRGVPSLDPTNSHLPNLWVDQYAVGNARVTNEVFRGYRHATLAPYGPGMTEEMAKKTAEGRAKELLATMILSDQSLRAQAEEGREVTLNISSVSSLTPDRIRGLRGITGRKNERAMWKLQQATLRELSSSDKQPVELTLPDDRKVQVRVKALSFNFGINTGSVGLRKYILWPPKSKALKIFLYICLVGFIPKLFASLAETLLGWKKSDNQPGIDELRKAASDYNGPNKAKVDLLMGQIDEIWSSESYKWAGNDPAKMPARIMALSYLLGYKTAFNCKSGKDRTAILAVEAKFLLRELELTRTLPVPDQPLSGEQRQRYLELMRNSGNYDIQACNTGGARGYKIDKMMRNSYAKRLGLESVSEFVGLSGEASD